MEGDLQAERDVSSSPPPPTPPTVTDEKPAFVFVFDLNFAGRTFRRPVKTTGREDDPREEEQMRCSTEHSIGACRLSIHDIFNSSATYNMSML
ncbi:hypothetical protein EYF80_013332 [Liparis tanakae]|uniref:Uncharacterized protein n=1 Tax=Liparis tanakae TaxID=230148 RepID=A0A4Z2IF64_9TELE|nr:hypothetical protein EYF80_013332 [Liparis tanakae]